MQQRMLTSDLTYSNQLPNQLQPRNRIKSYCTFSMGFMHMFVMIVLNSTLGMSWLYSQYVLEVSIAKTMVLVQYTKCYVGANFLIE